ncbi:MAG: hypothetical protein Q9168_003518 [Polycauliona sp. 1 TL-2023]
MGQYPSKDTQVVFGQEQELLWRRCRNLTAAFPFEKLPAELQLEVVRYAMPPNGLPCGRLPYMTELSKGDQVRVPVNLFRVSRSMSAMALWTFYNDTLFHIEISLWGVVYFRGKPLRLDESHYRPSQLQLQGLPQFRRARSFQINVVICRRTNDDFQPTLKDRLRLVCDALADNPMIQRLTVTIPCLCGPRPIIFKPQDSTPSRILDILSPLKRVKVARPLKFEVIIQNNNYRANTSLIPCKHPVCQRLTHHVQQVMGRLDGMQLTHEEETWKRIKELDLGRPKNLVLKFRSSKSSQLLENLWDRLNLLQNHREMDASHDAALVRMFDSDAKETKKSLQQDNTSWRKFKARKLRRQNLRRYREQGPLAKLWLDQGLVPKTMAVPRGMDQTALNRKRLLILIHAQAVKDIVREYDRRTQEWHEQNPQIPGNEDQDDEAQDDNDLETIIAGYASRPKKLVGRTLHHNIKMAPRW